MPALAKRTEDNPEREASKGATRPVFRSLATSRPKRGARTFIVASVVLHVGLLGLFCLHRRAVSQASDVRVRVALVSPAALRSAASATPPAARPVEKRTLPRTSQPRPLPKPLLAPREIAPATQTPAPAAEPEPDDSGAESSGSGEPSAGDHGVGTAQPAVVRPPPPPPPPAPVFQNEANVRRRRVTGHDPAYPAKAERDGVEGVVVAKVVIGPDGRVNDVILMQTHPVFESTVRDAIAGWKFSPLVVNGQAASVYTVFRFTFKLS
jgi:periplasmic protein TonB